MTRRTVDCFVILKHVFKCSYSFCGQCDILRLFKSDDAYNVHMHMQRLLVSSELVECKSIHIMQTKAAEWAKIPLRCDKLHSH